MFWCCCVRLHRHQLHLASYGCVSFSLILTGIVFTVFAVFQKDSQIGKVWLAGPVLIVVGGVLCGKVMIDWGPAMERGRAGSMDSRIVHEYGYSNLLSTGRAKYGGQIGSSAGIAAHHLKIPVKNYSGPSSTGFCSPTSPNFAQCRTASPSNSAGHFVGFDRITYSPEVPASPFRMREMADKTTQAKEGCAKCAFLHSILDGRKAKMANENTSKGPKVIGKFVFSELNGGPSYHQQTGWHPEANYGALLDDERRSICTSHPLSPPSADQNHINNDNNNNNNPGRGERRKFYSQGETLIMNERSFLI